MNSTKTGADLLKLLTEGEYSIDKSVLKGGSIFTRRDDNNTLSFFSQSYKKRRKTALKGDTFVNNTFDGISEICIPLLVSDVLKAIRDKITTDPETVAMIFADGTYSIGSIMDTEKIKACPELTDEAIDEISNGLKCRTSEINKWRINYITKKARKRDKLFIQLNPASLLKAHLDGDEQCGIILMMFPVEDSSQEILDILSELSPRELSALISKLTCRLMPSMGISISKRANIYNGVSIGDSSPLHSGLNSEYDDPEMLELIDAHVDEEYVGKLSHKVNIRSHASCSLSIGSECDWISFPFSEENEAKLVKMLNSLVSLWCGSEFDINKEWPEGNPDRIQFDGSFFDVKDSKVLNISIKRLARVNKIVNKNFGKKDIKALNELVEQIGDRDLGNISKQIAIAQAIVIESAKEVIDSEIK